MWGHGTEANNGSPGHAMPVSNASMGKGFPKCSQSPAERRAPLLSQTETANPRGNVDTENPNETLYVYHPRRGSLWCIPTLGHCNHRIRAAGYSVLTIVAIFMNTSRGNIVHRTAITTCGSALRYLQTE